MVTQYLQSFQFINAGATDDRQRPHARHSRVCWIKPVLYAAALQHLPVYVVFWLFTAVSSQLSYQTRLLKCPTPEMNRRASYVAVGHYQRLISTPFSQGQIDYIVLWSIEIARFLDNLFMSTPADNSLEIYKCQRRLKSILESAYKGLI